VAGTSKDGDARNGWRLRTSFSLSGFLLLCLFSFSSSGASIRVLSEEEFAASARILVAVRILGSGQSFVKNEAVVTRQPVERIRSFKGNAPATFFIETQGGSAQLTHPSGIVENITTRIPGAPEFRTDEAYILSLERDPEEPELYRLSSWQMKRLVVETGQSSEESANEGSSQRSAARRYILADSAQRPRLASPPGPRASGRARSMDSRRPETSLKHTERLQTLEDYARFVESLN